MAGVSSNPSDGTASTATTMATGKTENVSVFMELTTDYTGHLEDDTVIIEVTFPAEQATKTRVWKDFRSTFGTIPKYLEDVK